MQIYCCGWPLVEQLATIWLLLHVRVRFLFYSSLSSLPFIALYQVCNSLRFGSSIYLDSYFMVYWLLLAVSVEV